MNSNMSNNVAETVINKESPSNQGSVDMANSSIKPVEVKTKKKKNILFIGAGILAMLVLGICAYFLANILNTPVKVKENVKLIHPVFEDYSKNMEKIVSDLKKESNSGLDSSVLERGAKKSENLVKEAESNLKNLQNLVDNIKLKQLEPYQQNIKGYIKESKALIDFEKSSAQMGLTYVTPIKDYEELMITVTGLSDYIYTQPSKYIEGLKEAIKKENTIIESLEAAELKGDLKDISIATINSMKTEVEFLEKMKVAVEKRSSADISEARQQYAADMQKNKKEINRLSDKLDDKTDDLADVLEVNKDKTLKEYNRLKIVYKF